MIFELVIALGLGAAAAGVVLLIYSKIRYPVLRFTGFQPGRKMKWFKHNMFKPKKSQVSFDKKDIYISLGVGILVANLTPDLTKVPMLFSFSFGVSLLIIVFIKRITHQIERGKKLKEIAILFEAVELYLKAGYSIMQSLRAAKILTPIIRPAIEKCLEHWAGSPKKALEQLKTDLKIQEGEILVSLLIYMERSGVKDVKGLLGREANNLERLRMMRLENKIATRPLLLVVYRILPLSATLGITVGSLLYRTYNTLISSGIFRF